MRNPMPIPLTDAPYANAYSSVGLEVCENMYLERAGSKTSKADHFFIAVAGLRRLIEGTTGNACRGLLTASSGRVFGVFGQFVYEILPNWSRVLRFSLETFQGRVGMADNGQYMLVVDGQDGWTLKYEDNSYEKIDQNHDGNEGFVPGATHCTCLDTYFLVNVPGSNDYVWSNAGYGLMTSGGVTTGATELNAGHWNGLNTARKVAKPDNIMALGDCNNMVWLFGQRSTEVHYNTGNYPGVFARYEGAIVEVGCTAKYSVAKYFNNIYWIGSDASGTVGVFTNEGYQPRRISVRGVEQIMQAMATFEDAIGMCYAENGHAYYLLHFPSGDATFVYDIVTGVWHRRTFLNRVDGTTHRWKGSYCTFGHGTVIWGDQYTDAVYTTDQYKYANDNPTGTGVNYIQTDITTPIGFQNGKLIRYLSIQPMLSQGVGLGANTDEGVGLNPQAIIKFSDDSGMTWTQGRLVSIGRRGEYAFRSRLTTLGEARNRVWRMISTDPVRRVFVGLLAEAQVKGS